MKKLNKILAAISTAALTFCVWGTQTQAKVVTNENDVPTHIEAKNKDEFFRDLQQVLNYIESQLAIEGDEPLEIRESFIKENGLTDQASKTDINYYKYAEHQYKYASKQQKITINIATGYLYNLFLNSTIGNQKIQNVYLLSVELKNIGNTVETVFQLPCEENVVYYTPCLRWFLWANWMRKNELTPTPMTVRESFEKGPEVAVPIPSYIHLCVNDPNAEPGRIITTFSYLKTELTKNIGTIIPKLISIAGIRIEDEELGLAFKSHSNTITDYKKFVEAYNKKQK